MRNFLLSLLLFLWFPSPMFAQVVISEIGCIGHDYIIISNLGTESIDIGAWRVQVNDGSNHHIDNTKNGATGSDALHAGSSATLAKDPTAHQGDTYYVAMSLPYTGATVHLKRNVTEVADSATYPETQEGVCFKRDSANSEDEAVSSSVPVNQGSGSTHAYTVDIIPPEDIFVRLPERIHGVVGGQVFLNAELYDATGKEASAQCRFTFGDGTVAQGCNVFHTYKHPGTYLTKVEVNKGNLQDSARTTIQILPADVAIAFDADENTLMLTNNTEEILELNGWSFRIDSRRAAIPDGTLLSPKAQIVFDASIIPIVINQYGGVVELWNADNRFVTDTRQVPAVNSLPEDMGEEVPAVSVATTTRVVAPLVPALETPPNYRPRTATIIGTRVATQHVQPPVATPEINTKNLVSVDKDTAVLATAAAGSMNVPHTQYSLIPQNALTWLVGLMALFGLALVPRFIKNSEEGVDTHVSGGDDDASQFTIQELR